MVHHSGRITGFSLFAPSGLEVGVKGEGGRVRNHRRLSKLNYKNGEKKSKTGKDQTSKLRERPQQHVFKK